MADDGLFKLSLTSSNWSVDRAISVAALSSDKGQSPFAAQAAEKGALGKCACVCVRERANKRVRGRVCVLRSPEEKVDS